MRRQIYNEDAEIDRQIVNMLRQGDRQIEQISTKQDCSFVDFFFLTSSINSGKVRRNEVTEKEKRTREREKKKLNRGWAKIKRDER